MLACNAQRLASHPCKHGRVDCKESEHFIGCFRVAFANVAGDDLSSGRLRYQQSLYLAADSAFLRTHMVPVYLGSVGWIMHFLNRAAACEHPAKQQMFWSGAANERD